MVLGGSGGSKLQVEKMCGLDLPLGGPAGRLTGEQTRLDTAIFAFFFRTPLSKNPSLHLLSPERSLGGGACPYTFGSLGTFSQKPFPSFASDKSFQNHVARCPPPVIKT